MKSEKSWKMRASSRLPLVAMMACIACTAVVANAQTRRRVSSNRDVRLYARLLAMTDSRTFDRALVDSAIASGWQPLRAAASLAVGQVGALHGMVGAPSLRSLLGDADQVVASNAAYALGLLRDSMAVPLLATNLGGRPRVAREAAWALGEIGAPARSAIISALASPVTDESRTIQILLAAAKLRPLPVAEIRPYLSSGNKPSILWAAAYAIARTHVPAGVRDLAALATRPDVVEAPRGRRRSRPGSAMAETSPTADAYVSPATALERVRAEIARGLAKTAAGDSLAEASITVLTKLALDPDPHVRINAVRSLATYGDKGRSAVVAATRDRDPNTRIAAAQSLGTVLDSTTKVWLPLWSADTSFMFRSSLLASAVHAGATLPQFVSWQGHPDWRYRAAVLNAVGDSPNRNLAAELGREMTADTDPRVRAAAYQVIAGRDSVIAPAVHDALIRGLSDPDFMVRATLLGSLAPRANAADASLVVDVYEKSARDSSNDARIAAIQYLAAAWKRDSAGFRVPLRERIARLKPSSDPLVREPALHTAAFHGWDSTSGTSRPIEWYQSLVHTYVLPALSGSRQRATIRTVRGDIVLELFGADAPITVNNFLALARSGYYRGTRFHRVVPNFVAQDGDPRGDGNGGPGYAIRDEMNPRRYDRGALGMALSGPDTGGSQYFITHSPQPHLDGHYTVFGRVIRGFGPLDALVQGDRILGVLPQ